MRRTRHVALPVRAWQYIGLLIVSLACLTLGLVSRDKEGRAGSLAGPELQHQAPHEVDACPNFSPFTKMPSYANLDQVQTSVPKASLATRTTRAGPLPDALRISRSRSLDRDSRNRLQSRRDSRRLTSRETTDSSRLGTRNQDSQRRSSDQIRLSRSMDFDGRLATRSLDRRSRNTEHRSAVDRRENREALARRIFERQAKSNDRFDVRDRISYSVERRELTSNRGMRQEDRREIRERRSRSLDRREPVMERRIREKQEIVREDRRRNLVNRMDRRAEDRRSSVRSDLEENRGNVRSSLDIRRNSVASRDQNRRSVRTRQPDSGSRGTERTTRQYSRSLNRQNSRITNDLSERRLSKRSVSLEERRERNFNSRTRSMDLGSTDSRRERIDRSPRTTDNRNRVQLTTRRDSRIDLDRRSLVRSERRQGSSERRERTSGLDHRSDARSNERRESSVLRSFERSRLDNTDRRERTNRFARLARSSETVKRDVDRRARDLSRDRRTERKGLLDSRSMEQRSNDNDLNRREARADRSERRRSTDFDSVNRREIRTDRSRINNSERRERISRLNVARDMRESRTRLAVATESPKRDLERRVRDLSSDRRSERRVTVDSRSLESGERREISVDRSRIDNLERRGGSRLISASRARIDSARTSKRDLERRVRDLSSDRRSERRAIVDSRRSMDRKFQDNASNRREIRTDERSERRAALVESRRSSRSFNSINREETRTDRRASERSTLRSDRREISNRIDLARESRIPVARTLERRARDLTRDRRSERRVVSVARMSSKSSDPLSRHEVRTDRRLAEKIDRNLDSKRFLRQKINVNRSQQRIGDLSNDIQLRQRLITPRRSLNDARRSRQVDQQVYRDSRKDSMDSLRDPKSFTRGSLNRVDDVPSRMKTLGTPEIMKADSSMMNSMTVEVVRQAIVIGLCAVYGLSIFNGKQSFISNVIRQAPRFILW